MMMSRGNEAGTGNGAETEKPQRAVPSLRTHASRRVTSQRLQSALACCSTTLSIPTTTTMTMISMVNEENGTHQNSKHQNRTITEQLDLDKLSLLSKLRTKFQREQI